MQLQCSKVDLLQEIRHAQRYTFVENRFILTLDAPYRNDLWFNSRIICYQVKENENLI